MLAAHSVAYKELASAKGRKRAPLPIDTAEEQGRGREGKIGLCCALGDGGEQSKLLMQDSSHRLCSRGSSGSSDSDISSVSWILSSSKVKAERLST